MSDAASASEPVADGAVTRILIVDDHPLVRRGLAQLIDATPDLEVVGEAADRAEFFALLDDREVDIAIVDLSLEDESGLELLGELRRRRPAVKSIVVSIHDAELYAPRALRAGASGYVSKTQPCEEVLDAIRGLVAGEPCPAPGAARRSGDGERRGSVDLLSDRELQVFELIGHGRTTGDIARALHLSTKTVETHRQRIKDKLGIDSGTKLLIRASQWVEQNA